MKHARVFTAIFLVSTATLTYEIGLTRLFSISQGYHFAFMVISIALLGIGAGGAVMMIAECRVRNAKKAEDEKNPSTSQPLNFLASSSQELRTPNSELNSFLSTLAALLSIVFVLSFIAANQIMFDPIKAAWSRLEFSKILAQYVILSLPFTITGMAISAAIRSLSGMVHRIYLSDMAGAGTGCILVLYILSKSGGEGVVVVSAALSLMASVLFRTPSRAKDVAIISIAAAIFALAVFSSKGLLEVRMSPYRELSAILNFPGAKVIETVFSPSGRMDIVESPAVRAAPGISLSYQSPLPRQIGFTINGGGLSTVTDRNGDLSFLRHLPSSLPYRIRKGGDVFIIDPGGGMEVLSAIENGAKGVWGSETKGVVLDAMKGRLSGFSGGLYDEMDVRHGYGGSVLREAGKTFDIIQVPLTDTTGATSSGIRGLQEEYNLTVEAFSDYMKHLKKDGFMSASIYLLPPPRQELKLLATIAEALEITSPSPQSPPVEGGEATLVPSPLAGEGQGEGGFSKKRAEDRIIAIRSWGVLTILAKNGLISASDIETVKEFCRSERFDPVWYPGMGEDEADVYNRFSEPLYYRLFKRVLEKEGRDEFFREYIFDIRPPTDDRPFFGQTFKMTRIRETYESVGRKWGILIEGGYLLPWILIQALAASLILIMAPLLLIRRSPLIGAREMVGPALSPSLVRINSAEGGRGASLLSITAYFSSIGIGYMFLEISLIQRMVPVLGEPVYAISVVLFTLLLSTGAGSYLSGRFRLIERYSIHIILMIPLLAVLYPFLIGQAAERIAGTDMSMRSLLSSILILPLGIAMGIPFPTGMSILGRKLAGLIPWAWCINGSSSVTGSVLAMAIALAYGFSAVNILAAVSYLIAWLAISRLR